MVPLLALMVLASPPNPKVSPTGELLGRLRDPVVAEAALAVLVARGESSAAALAAKALDAEDLSARGWAIAGLGEIGGPRAARALTALLEDPSELVRVWAAAALIRAARDLDELQGLAPLVEFHPMAQSAFDVRTIELRLAGDLGAAALLTLARDEPSLSVRARNQAQARPVEEIVAAMLEEEDGAVRRDAAALLAELGERGVPVLVKAMRFDPTGTHVPWRGGPLYLPALPWTELEAAELGAALIAWHHWCSTTSRIAKNRALLAEKRIVELGTGSDNRDEERAKIDIALRGLGPVLGWSATQDSSAWITELAMAVGRAEAVRLLEEQGLPRDGDWTRALGPFHDAPSK